MLESWFVDCPWCGEGFEADIDTSAGDAEYVEDCRVCCAPVVFRIRLAADGSLLAVETLREGD